MSLKIFRIGFALTAMLWLFSLSPFLLLFYGGNALCPLPIWNPPSAVISLVWWIALAAAITLLLGKWNRPAAVTFFLAAAYFFRTPCRSDNYGDQIFVATAFLMIFLPRPEVSIPSWYGRTFRLYAGTLYLIPVLYRMGGTQWWNGKAAWTALADPSTSRIWESISRDPWAIPTWVFFAITFGSMAFEGLFPFLIWVKRLRVPLVVAGIVFHAGMGLVLNLGLFPFQMMVVLLGCLIISSPPSIPERPGPRPTVSGPPL